MCLLMLRDKIFGSYHFKQGGGWSSVYGGTIFLVGQRGAEFFLGSKKGGTKIFPKNILLMQMGGPDFVCVYAKGGPDKIADWPS